MNGGVPYSFLKCMGGYISTPYISGTTGLVRPIRIDLLLGVYVYKVERLIPAEYKHLPQVYGSGVGVT